MKGIRSKNHHHFLTSVLLILLLMISMSIGESASWDCPECGRKGNTGNYCGGCAHPSPWIGISKEAFQTVGNIVKFGHYEQDNNLNNGKEDVEWIVLEAQEGKSLLLSRYLLDAKPYNENYYGTATWETCTLRKWLNGEFLEDTFSGEEQSAILTTIVDNSSSSGFFYSTNTGNNTQDRLFLLSGKEVFELYFSSNEERESAITDYADARGAYYNVLILKEGRRTGWWWLRSSGQGQHSAAYVYYDGSLRSMAAYYHGGCVRPAFWINLESEIF